MTPLRSWAGVLAVALAVSAADRMTKIAACALLAQGQSIPVLPGLFHITLVFNTGAAFGLLKDQQAFFIAVSILAIAAIVFYLWTRRTDARGIQVALGLIMGGAFGNLFDRVTRGHVIDFLDFRIWPVFNVADTAITVGAVFLVAVVAFRRAPER